MNSQMSASGRRNPLRQLLMTALFAALTAIGAFLRIPAGVTSFTLQTFFCCMAGVLLGPYWGAASQLVYVLLGLVGLPVFAEGGGLTYLTRPSAGFLLGLVPMAFVTGLLSRRLSRSGGTLGRGRLALSCLGGVFALYLLGLPYLYFALAGAMPFGQCLVNGCLIFLPFDGVKLLCAVLLASRLLPLLHRGRLI